MTLLLGGFIISTFYWSSDISAHRTNFTAWGLRHVDVLLILLAGCVGVAIASFSRRARPAVAVGSSLVVTFLGAHALSTIIECSRHLAPPSSTNDVVHYSGNGSEYPITRLGHVSSAFVAQTSAPPHSFPHLTLGKGCRTIRELWPVVLCILMLLVALLQTAIACAIERHGFRERLVV